jgi:hypothetical protein
MTVPSGVSDPQHPAEVLVRDAAVVDALGLQPGDQRLERLLGDEAEL